MDPSDVCTVQVGILLTPSSFLPFQPVATERQLRAARVVVASVERSACQSLMASSVKRVTKGVTRRSIVLYDCCAGQNVFEGSIAGRRTQASDITEWNKNDEQKFRPCPTRSRRKRSASKKPSTGWSVCRKCDIVRAASALSIGIRVQ